MGLPRLSFSLIAAPRWVTLAKLHGTFGYIGNKRKRRCGTIPVKEREGAAHSRPLTLAALFIVGVAAFANLYATQPLLPRFRQFFRASELLVSLTVSAAVLAVALTAPLIGSFADWMGRKRVIVASLMGLALATLLSGTSANLGQLIVWRFVQGCFVPGVIAVTMAYIAEESQPGSIGTTMATYVTGTIIGGFGGRFISGLAAAPGIGTLLSSFSAPSPWPEPWPRGGFCPARRGSSASATWARQSAPCGGICETPSFSRPMPWVSRFFPASSELLRT